MDEAQLDRAMQDRLLGLLSKPKRWRSAAGVPGKVFMRGPLSGSSLSLTPDPEDVSRVWVQFDKQLDSITAPDLWSRCHVVWKLLRSRLN